MSGGLRRLIDLVNSGEISWNRAVCQAYLLGKNSSGGDSSE